MRVLTILVASVGAATIGGAALAKPPAGPAACALSDISPTALACTGFYSGNLLNGSPADIASQKTALALLGYTFDGNFNNVEKISSLNGSHSVTFGTVLKGISFVAFHFGGGQGGPGQATAFYKIDAGAGIAMNVINLAYNASSNAALYATNVGGGGGTVPEPSAWAMMLAGFAAVGVARRRKAAAVAA